MENQLILTLLHVHLQICNTTSDHFSAKYVSKINLICDKSILNNFK